MTVLTEGGLCSGEIYKHGLHDGGRHPWEPHSINITLLAEGKLALSWIQSDKITTPMQVPF